jgi:ketosteroid isomerase-like protein
MRGSLMPADSSPADVMRSYWGAECQRDLDGVLRHYAPDALLRDPAGVYRGRAEIARYYADSMREFPGLEITIVDEIISGSRGAFEFEARLTRADGTEAVVRGLSLVSVRDGVLEYMHCYEDAPASVSLAGSQDGGRSPADRE